MDTANLQLTNYNEELKRKNLVIGFGLLNSIV